MTTQIMFILVSIMRVIDGKFSKRPLMDERNFMGFVSGVESCLIFKKQEPPGEW